MERRSRSALCPVDRLWRWWPVCKMQQDSCRQRPIGWCSSLRAKRRRCTLKCLSQPPQRSLQHLQLHRQRRLRLWWHKPLGNLLHLSNRPVPRPRQEPMCQRWRQQQPRRTRHHRRSRLRLQPGHHRPHQRCRSLLHIPQPGRHPRRHRHPRVLHKCPFSHLRKLLKDRRLHFLERRQLRIRLYKILPIVFSRRFSQAIELCKS
mmetsp:Transcript_34016/g.78021  ORF Transcript_34016/g.78021 Transcript_34016/m.78021 type:complete len:204 (+) Transcript_34016:803-1414(+)